MLEIKQVAITFSFFIRRNTYVIIKLARNVATLYYIYFQQHYSKAEK